MRLYGDMLSDQKRVKVPKVVERLSTGRLLTMEWVSGEGIKAFLEGNPTQAARK